MSKHGDPWRYRCPNGHCSWSFTQAGHYRCPKCRENGDEYKHQHLIDMKTKKKVTSDAL